MMGRFIDGIVQCQQACRETRKYEVFHDDPKAKDLLLLDRPSHLMTPDVRLISHSAIHILIFFKKN
jgi:hypothetical protein